MSAALSAATPEPDPEAAFQRQVLHDLTVWCADVAYRLRDAVEAAETTDDLVRLAAAFDTAARGTRRSVMLARHVARPPRPEPTPPTPKRPTHLRLAAHPTSDAETSETADRLDPPDPLPDHRPVTDQAAAIRAELTAALADTPHADSPRPDSPRPDSQPDRLSTLTASAAPSATPKQPPSTRPPIHDG